MSDRYQAGNQGAFQPGSKDRVLCNKLALTDPEEMDQLELLLLEDLYQSVLVQALPDRTLMVDDIKSWHRRWLGNVYNWAGEERSVNMSKGDFHFAVAAQIPRLLTLFERELLTRPTPCHDLHDAALNNAVARIHVEFILIHPFREGNGRLSRLLADVMVVQAGHGPLDYSAWDADRDVYFDAIGTGLGGNYAPMQRLVEQARTG